jgi:hypothetical protein
MLMAATPARFLDLARGLGRCGQLTQKAGVRRGGLGRSHGNKAGESAGYDGQRNGSIHLYSLRF